MQRTHYAGPNAMCPKMCHSQAQLGFPRPMDMDMDGPYGWTTSLATDPLRGSQCKTRMVQKQEDVIVEILPLWSFFTVIRRRISIASRLPLPRSGSGRRRVSWLRRRAWKLFFKKKNLDFYLNLPGRVWGGLLGSWGALKGQLGLKSLSIR